jgi:hypothetical protein
MFTLPHLVSSAISVVKEPAGSQLALGRGDAANRRVSIRYLSALLNAFADGSAPQPVVQTVQSARRAIEPVAHNARGWSEAVVQSVAVQIHAIGSGVGPSEAGLPRAARQITSHAQIVAELVSRADVDFLRECAPRCLKTRICRGG